MTGIRVVLTVAMLGVTGLSNAQKVEAEDGILSGTEVASELAGYSGSGYVTGFDTASDAVTMTLEVDADGLYELWIGYAGPFGEKTNDVYVNGIFAGSQIFPARNTFDEILFGKVRMEKGENTVSIKNNWGYFYVDYIRVQPGMANDIHNYREELLNEHATASARLIYRYLRDLYGHRIISGQQSDNGTMLEADYIMEKTGRWPALRGFDLIDYSPSRIEHGTTSDQTMQADNWWDQGGLVTMMWHWNAPKGLLDTEDAPWWAGFYTYATTFDLTVAMNDPGSEEYQFILRDIDAIAAQLSIMQEAGTPVLWRPLHEAEGGWFWWGAKGPAPFVWLWRLMYDRLTNYHELNNLIWIWTGTNSPEGKDWYPGDDYVDIIGADIYLDARNYSAGFSMFDDLAGIYDGKKLITMSETGTLPDPESLEEEKARWSWFCSWSKEFIMDPEVNEVAELNKVYTSDYVITYDELPDFSNYVSPEFSEETVTGMTDLYNLVTLYPNPVSTYTILQAPSSITGYKVRDVSGREVSVPAVNGDEQQIRLDVMNLPSGVYLISVSWKGGSRTLRMIK